MLRRSEEEQLRRQARLEKELMLREEAQLRGCLSRDHAQIHF